MSYNKIGGGSIEDQVLVFLILLPASLCDLHRYRVPNVIICIGLALSLYRKIWQYGIWGVWYFSIGCLVPFVVCFIFYLLHMFGAGDIKLFSIIFSYYTIEYGVRVMIVSLLAGAFFSVSKMLLQRSFFRRFRHLSQYVKKLAAGETVTVYYDLKKCGDEGVIPFTICITLAVIICMAGK